MRPPRGMVVPPATIYLFLATFVFPVVARDYFEKCGAQFLSAMAEDSTDSTNSTIQLIRSYHYTETPRGLRPGHTPPPLITFKGCVALCGGEAKGYPWPTISDTITTWVLPLAGGLILQLPFESNQRFATLFTICRWLGSPIATLMYILWNIKVTARCALFVDMSTARNGPPGNVRNSVSKQMGEMVKTVRKYFGTDRSPEEVYTMPDLTNIPNADDQRQASAFAEIRDSMYLLSVFNQYALSHRDPNHTIDLLEFALFSRSSGLPEIRHQIATDVRRERKHGVVQVLLSIFWFLVALTISIYKAFGDLGANATAHNLALGLLMSWLPVLVSTSLVDRNPNNEEHVRMRLSDLLDNAEPLLPGYGLNPNSPKLIGKFSGQARERWHYGIAHSILSDIEDNIDNDTRNARGLYQLYLDGTLIPNRSGNQPQVNRNHAQIPYPDLWKFDLVETWQGGIALAIVACSAFGAFTISYHTPTVGLGCRSGGYMVYGVLATGGLIFEAPGFVMNQAQIRTVVLRVFITSIEIVNTGWLIYIIIAQTFGLYNSCMCKSSLWGITGKGYADFANTNDYRDGYDIIDWWTVGTVLGTLPLLAIIFVVYQWLTQSFLWSQDYEKALTGLRRVRTWRWIFHRQFAHDVFILPPYRLLFNRGFKGLTWRR